MRITNNLLVRRQLAGLQSNAQSLEKAQSRVTSGLRVARMSDDPTSGSGIMLSASGLRAVEQYRRNVQSASSRVSVEDSVLQQVTSLLTRAKELGISQSGATATDATRAVASRELEEIFRQVVSLANTKLGEEFLFGGETGETAPFQPAGTGTTLDFTQSGGTGARAVEIGRGMRFTATHDGTATFVDSGVLSTLRDLARATAPGGSADPDADIATSLGRLDAAFAQVQALVGETGARANSLQMAASNLDAFEGGLKTLKSDLEDVDFEAAVTELVSRQTAYQAAMLASSKVLGLNLTDYLR